MPWEWQDYAKSGLLALQVKLPSALVARRKSVIIGRVVVQSAFNQSNNTMSRIGLGNDTHRLVAGTAVVLGGVTIPHDKRLDGFSDADVLTHAVIDAVLGAAGLGDIGELFPDTSEVNRGRNSLEMLARVADEVAARGYRVVNLDAVVMAERPKISPHKQTMRTNIAAALGVEIDSVNVKGKTGEGVGIIGREEAISAECVVLLEKL